MAFVMRTTKPGAGNKYYIRKASGGYSDAVKGSPTDPECDVLANCVGYAVGRFNEIGGWGSCKYLSPVNAENFIEFAGGLTTGQTPRVGACMVWQKGATLSGSDGAGHVAIVEKVISDTEIITSESGWGSSPVFWTTTRKKGDGNWGQSSSYKFRGFIYNPAPSCSSSSGGTSGGSTPTPTPAVDKDAMTKEWQTFLGVPADGKPGPDTERAALKKMLLDMLAKRPLRNGDKGNAVGVLQGLLYAAGYDPKGLDKSYGSGCAAAVSAFERDVGQTADGSAGVKVVTALWDKVFG